MAKTTTKTLKQKEKLAKKINTILSKTAIGLVKDLDKLMKDEGVWYSQDDCITRYDDMHKPNDRNADQLFLDHIASALDRCFVLVKPDQLWSQDDISKEG